MKETKADGNDFIPSCQFCCRIPGIFKWVECAAAYKATGEPNHYMPIYVLLGTDIYIYRYRYAKQITVRPQENTKSCINTFHLWHGIESQLSNAKPYSK